MNGSPVMQALALARIEQEPTAFGKWCIQRNVRPLPAAPAHVAAFIRDAVPNAPIETIGEELKGISRSHLSNGFADPTAGGIVAETMNGIAKIDPPRSWPADEKSRFRDLPYDLQTYVARASVQREKEVRRAHNEADIARKALAALKQSKEQEDGTTRQDVA